MIDWHLDPAERAAALLPMATWLPGDVAIVAGRPVWVVQGLIRHQRFPLASRSIWRGKPVGGMVPAFIATMDPVSGTTQIYLDPGADSTAAAWTHFFPGLVHPALELPADLRAALPYPAAWLDVQLQVLEAPEWGLGHRPGQATTNGPPGRPVPTWLAPSAPARQAVFEDPERSALTAVATAQRVAGYPTIGFSGPRLVVRRLRTPESWHGSGPRPCLSCTCVTRAAPQAIRWSSVRFTGLQGARCSGRLATALLPLGAGKPSSPVGGNSHWSHSRGRAIGGGSVGFRPLRSRPADRRWAVRAMRRFWPRHGSGCSGRTPP